VGLLTAADVGRRQRGVDGGVVVDATVGITKPTWAASADGGWSPDRRAHAAPGTINLVVDAPVCWSPGAAVNVVMTATEAKTQALIEHGVPGTGTASDAVVVVWDPDAPVAEFGGPRSEWGARVARATHVAVARGIEAAP